MNAMTFQYDPTLQFCKVRKDDSVTLGGECVLGAKKTCLFSILFVTIAIEHFHHPAHHVKTMSATKSFVSRSANQGKLIQIDQQKILPVHSVYGLPRTKSALDYSYFIVLNVHSPIPKPAITQTKSIANTGTPWN